MAEVRWTITASEDIRLLEEWIARDSPLNATEFTDRLVQSAAKLAELPHIGRKVPELDEESIRELNFRGYRIVYLLAHDQATILRVVHGARDLGRLLSQEPWKVE